MIERNYRPCNGTEGHYFMAQTWYRCTKDHQWHGEDAYGDESCPILLSSMVGEFAYPNELGPPEWSYDSEKGEFGCAGFEGPCACDRDDGGDDEPPNPFNPGPDHGVLFEVIDETPFTPMEIIQREADVELTWKALAAGDLEDEELSRIFLGSALDPVEVPHGRR